MLPFLVDSSAVTMNPVVVQKVFRLRLHLHRRNVVHRVYFALFAQITILIQILRLSRYFECDSDSGCCPESRCPLYVLLSFCTKG